MKKIMILVSIIILMALAGCSFQETELYYDGKLRPVSQIEEIIADKLEVENPDMDLEISVYEESEE
ncbi:hypothetical protein [Bacillus mesophilum]|uniref:Uncharacterized protein n=1 Tax=Bacillus mesophilum TaxID=1071718 RepID=A0A7V7UWU3_9BACI|nr:hypothetical protein [Bacillus mesophilum]KAB2334284.1 hypothetical protein F7732_09445 [Bacillus mesophilum]